MGARAYDNQERHQVFCSRCRRWFDTSVPYRKDRSQIFFCPVCGHGEVANYLVKRNVRRQRWDRDMDRWVTVDIEYGEFCPKCGQEMSWTNDGEWYCRCGHWIKPVVAKNPGDKNVVGVACPQCNYTVYVDRNSGFYYCSCGTTLARFEVDK